MAALGLSMLQNETRAAETAEAKRMDKSEQDSALAVAARGLQDCLERALQFHAQYMGLTDGTIEVNQEFEHLTLDSTQITAYSQLHQAGQISLDTLWAMLEDGNVAAGRVRRRRGEGADRRRDAGTAASARPECSSEAGREREANRRSKCSSRQLATRYRRIRNRRPHDLVRDEVPVLSGHAAESERAPRAGARMPQHQRRLWSALHGVPRRAGPESLSHREGEMTFRPVDQEPGGCWVACFASITGISLEEFPKPPAGYGEPSNEDRCAYHNGAMTVLHRHGWTIAPIGTRVPIEGWAVASGPSPRNGELEAASGRYIWHAVVWKDGACLYDPHPSRAMLGDRRLRTSSCSSGSGRFRRRSVFRDPAVSSARGCECGDRGCARRGQVPWLCHRCSRKPGS
jgi:hypothetical protein